MQYTVKCPSCYQQLTVNPGWEGQNVNCPLCSGPFVMPSSSNSFIRPELEPVKTASNCATATASAPSLWNPNAAANWSVLFSPVFGTALHYLNWRSLGDEKKATVALNWLYVAAGVEIWVLWNVFTGINTDAPFLTNLVFLVSWYFFSAKVQINHVRDSLNGRFERRSWLNPLGTASACVFLLFQAATYVTPGTFTGFETPRMYALSGDEALKEARNFMIGTWTYTGPDFNLKNLIPQNSANGPGVNIWMKWVVNEDGTVVKYKAPASSDAWGLGKKASWEVKTGKFVNTGLRYYQFCSENTDKIDELSNVVITRDGKLEYRLENNFAITMERGDKFPFSK